VLVCTLGDLLLDVVVRLDGPIAADTDTYGQTRVGAGGQAANVAAWVVALGGRARFLGKRARDPAGRIVADELTRRGVDVRGPELRTGTGTVVSLAGHDGTRAMLSDRGVATLFAPEELDAGWLAGCDVLHVPGYSLVAAPLAETALAAAQLVPKVSLDVSSTAAIESVGVVRFREQVERLQPAVVFATEAEIELVGTLAADTLVVKRGPAGCVVHRRGAQQAFAARPAQVVDTTGAGDAFAAGFLLGGPELGLDGAARCVAELGAMP
jgi:ribokinase